MLHMELPLMSDQVMLNGQTYMTDGHMTKNTHEPVFCYLLIHNFCMTNSVSTEQNLFDC